MAPIITAVELTFRPIDAMNIAQAKIQRLAPLNEMFFKTSCKTLSCFSSPSCKLNKLCRFILFIVVIAVFFVGFYCSLQRKF